MTSWKLIQIQRLTVWVDADACPVAIKEILFRTAERLAVETVLVANQSISVPRSNLIRRMTVRDGADIADDRIVELMQPYDIVITADIPLAARVVDKGGVAIGTRGELYDDASVHRAACRPQLDGTISRGWDGNQRPETTEPERRPDVCQSARSDAHQSHEETFFQSMKDTKRREQSDGKALTAASPRSQGPRSHRTVTPSPVRSRQSLFVPQVNAKGAPDPHAFAKLQRF